MDHEFLIHLVSQCYIRVCEIFIVAANYGEQTIFNCPHSAYPKQSYHFYCHFHYVFLLFFLLSISSFPLPPFSLSRQISVCPNIIHVRNEFSVCGPRFTLLYSLYSFHVSKIKEYN